MFGFQPSPQFGGASGSGWIDGPPTCTAVNMTSNPQYHTPMIGVFFSLNCNQYNSGGAATSWSVDVLPPGLSLNTSSGVVSGTPTTSGSTSSQLPATNACTYTSQTLFLNFVVT